MESPNTHNSWLFFGGAYSNLQATTALREIAMARNIPSNQCVHTGDAIAYCAQPNETINELRDWGVQMIMGNCEESLALNLEDCGCGFNRGSSCDSLSQQWFDYANQRLSPSNRRWLASLPSTLTLNAGGVKALVFHGAPNNINQFLFENSPTDAFIKATNALNHDLFIGGHSGIIFTKEFDHKIWHNAGSIGMPANDGTPKTWYSIMTTDENKMIIEHIALNYEHLTTHQLMVEQKLTGGYHTTLINGLWPSVDILPEAQRQVTGNDLLAAAHTFNFSRKTIEQKDIASNHEQPMRAYNDD